MGQGRSVIEFSLRKALALTDGVDELNVSAVIDARSFIALVGPSGAGKTTLLRMLAGLATPDDGHLTVDGEVWFDRAKGINLPARRRSIGFVFQDYALFPHLTVHGNIAYALDSENRDWIDELLRMTALGELRDRLPATLSGGQKQRVAVARALARKPRLLLLDEPLSALDMEMRLQLQEQLAKLHSRFGVTTILVSHDIGEVFKLAQRVLRLERGTIAQSGTPAELFLPQSMGGKINLRAQVLAVRREDVVHIATLLLGQQIIDVIADPDEAATLRAGDVVSVSAKAFSPLLLK
jgi:molybdate transport system ATP-binding protein